MIVDFCVEVPAAPVQGSDGRAELEQLRAGIRSAEERAAGLEHALTSNRRIGIAIGILMCQLRLTEDQAIVLLKAQSQHCNVKVRELAETVIFTGTL